MNAQYQGVTVSLTINPSGPALLPTLGVPAFEADVVRVGHGVGDAALEGKARGNDMVDRRVAIVTAAGRGMGGACATELAGRGYDLALLSPSGAAVALAKELGGIGLTGLVANPTDLKALVADLGR